MTSPQPTTQAKQPASEQLSLVQRITALEDQIQRIYGMMARDRDWMDEFRARVGLTL